MVSIGDIAYEAILTQKQTSGTAPRMGRPPLKANIQTKPTLVRLPKDVADRIDAIAGPNKRAEFIRKAIDAELKKRDGNDGR